MSNAATRSVPEWAAAAMGTQAGVLSPADFARVNNLLPGNLAQVQAPPGETESPDEKYEGTWYTYSYNHEGTQYYLLVPAGQTVAVPEGAVRIEVDQEGNLR